MFESIVFFLLPAILAYVVFQWALAWSTGRPILARVLAWALAVPLIVVIVGAGRVLDARFYPAGRQVTGEVRDAAGKLNSDLWDVSRQLPAEFEEFVAAVVAWQAEHGGALTPEMAEQVTPSAGSLVAKLYRVASMASDAMVLEMWHKGMALDRRLLTLDPGRCASRNRSMIGQRPEGLRDLPQEELDFDTARRGAFDAGLTIRNAALPDAEGKELLRTLLAGMPPEDAADLQRSELIETDPTRVCELRIRFAEAVARSPRSSDLARFLYAHNYH